MKRYKLTDKHGQTYGGCQWGEGFTHAANGTGPLCSSGWIHVYTNPLLAILLNPIHANFKDDMILWECEVEGGNTGDGLKEGWTSVTTLHKIPLSWASPTQRVRFAILCTLQTYRGATYLDWAENWLSGKDCSVQAAELEMARSKGIKEVVWSASAAALAGTGSAHDVAVTAGWAVIRAATAARELGLTLDLVSIARQAMEGD